MKLFDIDEAILACVDLETGEIIDPDRLAALEMEREKKIDGIALWVKQETAMAKAIGEEIAKLQARKKACENKANSLKEFLKFYLEGKKHKSAKVSISYTHSKSVVVDDADLLPDDCVAVELKIDKVQLKKYLTDGEAIEGCHLEEKESLVIR